MPRALARVVAASALLATIGFGVSGAVPATAETTSAVVHESVPSPGTYTVSVVVTSSARPANRVVVEIGALTRTAIVAPGHPRASISVRVTIGDHGLTVRAIGQAGRPHLAVAMRRVAAKTPKTPKTAVVAAPPVATPAPAPAPAPTPAPPAAPATPQPPGAGSPYTNLVFAQDFAQTWASDGGSGSGTESLPSTWGFDHSGGCSGRAPEEASYPASSSDAYLSSQGLVIPVNSTGSSSYTSAQVDTGGRASWQYGTIEASITLPSGPGLCPAFWMYADNGTGEIDILEAPSFVGPTYGPVNGSNNAVDSIFTLHANNSQVFEEATTPAAWNPTGPNVYGVYWTPTSITWTVNYVAYASATPSQLTDPSLWSDFTSGKLHIIFDDGVGGWPGDPPSGTTYSQPMTVQWVKVYQ